MRKAIFLFFIITAQLTAYTQYWQQEVNYTIDVTLNDKEHSLDGFERIEYTNHSPDTLTYIWFHVWPNAYKNDKTAFSDQELLNGNTKFYFSKKEDRGYINRLDFKVNNTTCNIEDHPRYIDVIKVLLPAPLGPGQKIILSTAFFVKLPYNFSRGGHDGQSYQITQWYPKPAVYDKNGWHPMPYLDQGEFYSEFGRFDVRITLPKNYVVAATGELQDAEEKDWLLTRKDFKWEPIKQKTKIKGGGVKITTQNFPASSAETKTLHYTQDRVHDFAWFADKRFIVDHDTCMISAGKTIDIYTYYTPSEKLLWSNSVQYAKNAARHYSSQVGEYPYSAISVVQGPQSFGGGMEYPMITLISPMKSPKSLDMVIAHEIGHNWFYGILASNERDHAWMDEGINSFYENRYESKHYSYKIPIEKILFETFAREKLDQPIDITSEKFQTVNYDMEVYVKTSEWMRWMESQVGKETFDKAMQEYYRRWQFQHPQPEDLKKIMEENTGKNLDSAFSLLHTRGILPGMERKGRHFISVFNRNYFSKLLDNRSQEMVSVGPLLGFNTYDKLMVGGFITNLRLPINHIKFFVAPFYAIGSKTAAGIGWFDYGHYPDNNFVRKIDLFVNGSYFSLNKAVDSAGKKFFTHFAKLSPGIRFTLHKKDLRTSPEKYIQWRTYIINEEEFRFPIDTVINGIDTSLVTRITKVDETRVLNQLKIVVANYRALYPYRAELKAEQGKGFIRLAFEGNYFFNYPNNEGGANVRLFAGKFFYLNREKADAFRYALHLSAPKGRDDYTYTDYFLGRSANPFQESGLNWTLPYQQIMIRDGGLKLNTDVQGDIGTTDDWLSAINVNFDIPSKLNPLSLLPVKIPLKIFADLGTSAEFWKKGAEQDRFLYDAGIQFSFLKQTINIYVPIIYSPVFSDYLKSDFIGKKRFLKSISFSIDISHFNLKKFERNTPF